MTLVSTEQPTNLGEELTLIYRCDTTNCYHTIRTLLHTSITVGGWTVVGNKHYCPDHSHTVPIKSDPVNHPSHYTSHPSGVECIQITEHMNFCLGNAIKYLWRADSKGGIEDLQKAKWYIEREIAKRKSLEG